MWLSVIFSMTSPQALRRDTYAFAVVNSVRLGSVVSQYIHSIYFLCDGSPGQSVNVHDFVTVR